MNHDSTISDTARDFVRVMLRHKKKALSVFAAILLMAGCVICFWPRTYSSEAKLFVRVGRETVGLDPTATTGQMMNMMDSRETEINSALEILRSRQILEKVVDQLTPQKILDSAPPQAASGSSASSASSGGGLGGLLSSLDPVSDRERAVTTLSKSLSISAPKRTSVIEVSCTASSPKLAQEIVGTVLTVYGQEHARLNRTPGSFDFFAEQSALLEKKLADANEALRQAKNESGLVSIAGQRNHVQQQMALVETEMLQSEVSLASARARSGSLIASMDRVPARLKTEQTTGITNFASDEMRKALYGLELKEIELKSRFTDEHPLVQEVSKQVADARAIVNTQDKSRTQSVETVHPVRNAVMLDRTKEEAEMASAAARLATAQRQRTDLRVKLKSLNDHEVKIADAQRRVEQLETVFDSYVDKREQSRIEQELGKERISNVNVAQAPTLVEKPVSPNKTLTLAAGLVLALLGGIGIAMIAEHFDRSLHTAAEVERSLDVSVLMTIPRMQNDRVVAN
ncbi:MAG: hypothetical protein K8T25_03850 [Planctomycetia bacterium]|nr:hypothetical protein [Planctomycetia bacterium]